MKTTVIQLVNHIADDFSASILLISGALLSLVEHIQDWQRRHNPNDPRWKSPGANRS